MKKTYRAYRRIIMTALVISIVGVLLISNTINVKGQEKESKYIMVTVNEGDTLWNIAKDKCRGDIRKSIYDLRKVNNMSTANISPGQTIKIPIKMIK